MKTIFKAILVVIATTLSLSISAQTTPEEIMRMRPQLPDSRSMAEYMVTGENAKVQAYINQLDATIKSLSTELSKIQMDNSREVQKKQQHIQQTAAARQDAGKRMMGFINSLTPEQQQKMMSFRREEDSMNYIKSIGKWDEFMAIMSGVDPNIGNEELISEDETAWISKDLSAEWDAVLSATQTAKQQFVSYVASVMDEGEKVSEEAKKLYTTTTNLMGKETLYNLDIEKYNEHMVSFYVGKMAKWKQLFSAYLKTIENQQPVAQKADKQKEVTNRVGGVVTYGSIMQKTTYSKAFEYLGVAKNLFPNE